MRKVRRRECAGRSQLFIGDRNDYNLAGIVLGVCNVVHTPGRPVRRLRHSGISTSAADALLDRMLNKIDELCAERDRLKKEQPGHNKGKVFGGRHW